jgi:hypothetical protein
MSEQTNPEALWNRTPYRQRDRHLIDYQTYQLDGAREEFRGPPVTGDAYVACVGASQTFGRFVQAPFPNLIARALGIEVLNLGRGGAGPTFPLGNPLLLERINHARAAVVQVFSARSQSNSLFQVLDHGMFGRGRGNPQPISAADFYTALLQEDEQLARQIVAETRANYVQSMTELLDAITVPKVLFWFSVRAPEYREQWRLPIHRLFGDFPQLVNREMVDQLRSHSDRYVECVSRRGLPQPLPGPILSGAPGTPPLPPGAEAKTENRYYPSPEMHEEAAALLIPEVRALLDRR